MTTDERVLQSASPEPSSVMLSLPCASDTLSPRDEEILDAVLACIAEDGLARMSVADIAERAHASKATLYRRWGSREGLIMAAFAKQAHTGWAQVDTGSLRDDLVYVATKMANHLSSMGPALAELSAEMCHNQNLATMMRSQFLEAVNTLIEPAFDRARVRGELTTPVDTALIWESLKATLLYRLIFLGEAVGDLPERLVDGLVMPHIQSCS